MDIIHEHGNLNSKSKFPLSKGVLLYTIFLLIASCHSTMQGSPYDAPHPQKIIGQSKSLPETNDNGRNFCEEELSALKASYQTRQFKKSIFQASQIIQRPCDASIHFQVYKILGDIYSENGALVDAILFYSQASQPTNIDQRKQLMSKSLNLALQLGPETFVEASREIELVSWRKDLLLEVGRLYEQQKEYAAAKAVFNELLENFPEDRRSNIAKKTIEAISSATAFDKNRIGVLLPLSGTHRKIGNRILKAIEIAVDKYNREATDRNFHIVIKDTGADPEKAISAVNAFKREGIAGIIGPIVTAEEAAAESERLAIPMIVMTQKENIPQIGQYVLRSFITPEIQAEALVSFLSNNSGIYRYAIMYPEENYGIAFKNSFARTIEQFGGELTAVKAYPPGQTDFAKQICSLIKGYEKIEKDGAVRYLNIDAPRERHGNYRAIVDFDALFVPDSAEMAALIAPQLRYHDIDGITLIGTNLWYSKKLIEMAGPYVQGAIFPSAFDITSCKRENDYFLSNYVDDDEPPGFIEAIGFDTASMMLRALSKPGTNSRKKLLQNLLTTRQPEGLTGMSAFRPSGEPIIHLQLCQIAGKQSFTLPN